MVPLRSIFFVFFRHLQGLAKNSKIEDDVKNMGFCEAL